jgi:hypothetical protein
MELRQAVRAEEVLNRVGAVLQNAQLPHEKRVAIASRMINEFGLPQQLQALEQQDNPVECKPISLLKAPAGE